MPSAYARFKARMDQIRKNRESRRKFNIKLQTESDAEFQERMNSQKRWKKRK